MAKKMLIDATHAEETRVVVVDGNRVDEFDFENVNKRQLQGNIYLAKVTRVEPSLQAAFVDYGGNRHGFLAFAEIHPDYYQIPVADRKALLEEERALARAEDEEDNRPRRKPRSDNRPKAETAVVEDAVVVAEARPASDTPAASADPAEVIPVAAPIPAPSHIPGMDVIDLAEDEGDLQVAHRHDDRGVVASERNGDGHYEALDHASETDGEIESVADEDVAEEIRAPANRARAATRSRK